MNYMSSGFYYISYDLFGYPFNSEFSLQTLIYMETVMPGIRMMPHKSCFTTLPCKCMMSDLSIVVVCIT